VGKAIRVAAMLATVIAVAACATSEYRPAEGAPIVMGTGGPSSKVDGFDVWSQGASPARRYQRLGVADIRDWDNHLGQARIRQALANEIRLRGGDGAIVLDQPAGPLLSQSNSTSSIGGDLRGPKTDRYEIIRLAE
jgi:hypothetical protein